ncbi:unnamed protein product [Brassica oleracea]|uniref:(rape) hypothetical protein n=1 Tax=Brassica napus TaxID=3708 RepID=A0A816IHB7_BRANA|nr:unnamed protein product [Brassica napus]
MIPASINRNHLLKSIGIIAPKQSHTRRTLTVFDCLLHDLRDDDGCWISFFGTTNELNSRKPPQKHHHKLYVYGNQRSSVCELLRTVDRSCGRTRK